MSAPGRPKHESSLGEAVAQRPEGSSVSAPGRPKHESSLGEAVAQRPEGSSVIGEADLHERSEVRDGMRITWNAPIRMTDGAVLRADVYRPLDEDQRCPVILSHGVYAKGLTYDQGYPMQWQKMIADHPEILEGSTNRYQAWEVTDPERWVPHGYAVVRVDSRGAGWSEGLLDPMSPQETEDICETIAWAARQPWSTGAVGVLGISYYAVMGWRAATRRPPGLKAIIAWEGFMDLYRDSSRHGGILSEFAKRWAEIQAVTVQYGLGSRAKTNPHTGESIAGPVDLSDEELARNRRDLYLQSVERALDGEWWRARSADPAEVAVPFLSCANWGGMGIHPRGNFSGFTGAPIADKWLEVHGDTHWSLFSAPYGLQLQKRFFDHFLKGLDNDWREQPRVLLNVRHADGRFEPRAEGEWPLARTCWTDYYLDAASGALDGLPSGRCATASPREDSHLGRPGALDGLPSGRCATSSPREDSRLGRPGALVPERPAPAHATYRGLGDGLVFRTAPLAEAIEITGPVAARLYIASDTVDADLFLTVQVFDPQGRELTFQGALDPNTPIAMGWLRASHRRLDPERSQPWQPYHPHDREEPLTPGEIVMLDIEILPTCVVLPAGWSVGLSVRGCDYEYQGEIADFGQQFYYATRGTGGMTHGEPADRPAAVFDNTITLYTGGDTASYLRLPVIPPRA